MRVDHQFDVAAKSASGRLHPTRAVGDREAVTTDHAKVGKLYRSFSTNGNPTLKTTIAVMKALGIELTAKVPA
jgi:hypothetical protein